MEAGPAGMAGMPPLGAAGIETESAPLPILVPRGVIDFGNVPWASMHYTYPVPLPSKR
jgi:hypothetical protein